MKLIKHTLFSAVFVASSHEMFPAFAGSESVPSAVSR